MKRNKTILIASSSMLAAGMAHGGVIINYINQVTTSSDSGVSFDLNGDGNNDFKVFFDANNSVKPCVVGANSSSGSYPGSFPSPTPFVFNELNMNPVDPAGNDNNGVPVIPGGTMITSLFTVGAYTLTIGDPGGDMHGKNEGYLYQNGETTVVGQWPSGQDTIGYVGLAMVDTTLGTANYGWVQLDYNSPGSTITVIDTGYETSPNTPIVTPTPEPATVSLAGLAGAFVVLTYKIRRNQV